MKKILFFALFALSNLAYSACTTTISSGAAIATIVNSAASGSTICLNAGTYNWANTTVQKTSMTFIEPAPGVTNSQITINGLDLKSSRWLSFDGATIFGFTLGDPGVASALHITIKNSIIRAQSVIYNRISENMDINIEGNLFTNFSISSGDPEGLLFITGNSTTSVTVDNGVRIYGNTWDGTGTNHLGGDAIQINGQARGTLIENNEFKGIRQSWCNGLFTPEPHCDIVQMYGANRTTIKDNYIHDNDTGIMSPDGNGDNATITGNIFVSDGTYEDQILISDANAIVTHNTLRNARIRCGGNGTNVCTNTTIRDNIIENGFNLTTGQTLGNIGTVDHNLTTSAIGTGGIAGLPTYVGGANPTTKSGFQLTSGSLGHNAASDGTDMGATLAADTTPPTVSSRTPTSGATNVSIGTTVTATFNEPMNAATITTSTFTLVRTSDSSAVTASVSYNSGTNTATLTPSSSLASSTQYTATITTGVQDASGNAIASSSSWNFTTAAPDTTPPTVTGQAPASNATGVPISIAPTITFSEAMNAASISTSSIEIRNTSTSALVTSTVSYNSGTNTATITPTSNLSTLTQYTVTVKGGGTDPRVKDVALNALAANYTWNFTTGDSIPLTYTTDFKGQANGVSATITSNTLTAATGDFITVAAVYGDNADSTAWTVSNDGTAITWTQRAATNTASNTKVVLWTGVAGATPPTTVSVQSTAGAVTSGGKALFVAVHTGANSSNPIPTGNIFTGTGLTDASRSITPTSSGSALWMICGDWAATNSFAAIANNTAGTSYNEPGGMTANYFRPTTQPRTDANAFTLGETDASGKISYVAFEVQADATAPPDTTPPTISSRTPTSGATGVAIAVAPTVTFNEAMTSGTLTTSTFTLVRTSDSAPVTGTVSYNSGTNTATLTPSASLAYSTQYTATVTTGAQDSAGNALASNSSWSFTTTANPDTTPPTVSSATPTSNATGVAINVAPTATFSEALNAATVTTTTASIKRTSDNNPVTSTVGYNSGTHVVTVTPSASLAYSTQYTVTLTTGIQDVAGNALATNYTWNFTTATAPDTTPPTVSSTVPTSSATGVSISADQTVTFNEAMDAASISSSSIILTNTATSAVIPASVSYSSNVATINPTSDLANSTQYTVTVKGGGTDPRVKDVALNALATDYTWNFTTVSATFTPPPGLVARYDFEPGCFLCDTFGDNEGLANTDFMPVGQVGRIGDAAYFDGGDIVTASLPPGSFSNAYSFSFWVNRDAETTSNTSLWVRENLKYVSALLYDRWLFSASQQPSISGQYSFTIGFDNSTGINQGLIQAGQWAHIAITYGSNRQKLYVNGVLVSSARRVKQMPSVFNALRIGAATYGKRFKGMIDSFMVFNTELSSANVQVLYNQTVN